LLKSKFSEKDSNEINNKFILDIDNITTSVEKYIGFTNDDKTEGGRIDILIEDKNKKTIIIENKIYAFEQTKPQFCT
jgi:DNA-binding sugar fermentation-stimulating protein